MEQCHHALCEYGVYGLFLMKESPYTISYGGGSYRFESGIPTVRYLAGQLFLSPNYFGDLVRVKTGESASAYIRHFLMQKAKSMLLDGRSVSEVSDSLGFEYPQNLTRMFKKEFGIAPSIIDRNGTY